MEQNAKIQRSDRPRFSECQVIVLGACVQASLVTLTGYPLDLIKARLQSGLYTSSLKCLTGTIKNEGLVGLYRGSMMPWISHMMKRPVQYLISENLKDRFNPSPTNANANMNTGGKTFYNYLIGAGSGIFGPIVGTPLQVVKISMQTSVNDKSDKSQSKMKNSLNYIAYNYRTHGISGFYRGFIPTLCKDTAFGMSFIGNYYTFRDYFGTDKWYNNFVSGSLAHSITWCVFIPIDYVKTIIQKSETKLTVRDVVRSSYKAHGIFVFWKGVIPACARTFFVSGFAMTGYEYARQLLSQATIVN